MFTMVGTHTDSAEPSSMARADDGAGINGKGGGGGRRRGREAMEEEGDDL